MVRRWKEEVIIVLARLSGHQRQSPEESVKWDAGHGAYDCTKYVIRFWVRVGLGEVLAAPTPLALGRKMKGWTVLRTSSESMHFLHERFLCRFSATPCEIR